MKQRILCLLLALVLVLGLAPVLPRAEAFDTYNVSGTIKLSSYKTGDTLALKGNTTLKVDASVCLYGILSNTDSNGSPKYNLTIEGDGTHSLTIAGWDNNCINVKNLELKNANVTCNYNVVHVNGTLTCSNSVWSVEMSTFTTSPLLFVKSAANVSNSTIQLISKGSCYTCNSKTTLSSSTLTASAGTGATAIWTESLDGSKYTIQASGGNFGLMMYNQQYGISPTLIDVSGATSGIHCQTGNLSCAYTNILYPVNGTCDGTTVLDTSGVAAKRAVIGAARQITVSRASLSGITKTYSPPSPAVRLSPSSATRSTS